MAEHIQIHLDQCLFSSYNKDYMISTSSIDSTFAGADFGDKIIDIDINAVLPVEHSCSICLGILQVIDSPPIVSHIADTLRTEGYEFESFKFTVTTPLSCSLREQHRYLAETNGQGKDEEAAALLNVF